MSINKYIKHPYYDAGFSYHPDLYLGNKKILPTFFYNLFQKNNGMYGGKLYKYKSYDFIVTKSRNNNSNETVFFIGKNKKCLRATLADNDDTMNLSECNVDKELLSEVYEG